MTRHLVVPDRPVLCRKLPQWQASCAIRVLNRTIFHRNLLAPDLTGGSSIKATASEGAIITVQRTGLKGTLMDSGFRIQDSGFMIDIPAREAGDNQAGIWNLESGIWNCAQSLRGCRKRSCCRRSGCSFSGIGYQRKIIRLRHSH